MDSRVEVVLRIQVSGPNFIPTEATLTTKMDHGIPAGELKSKIEQQLIDIVGRIDAERKPKTLERTEPHREG